MCHFSPAGIWGNRTLNTLFAGGDNCFAFCVRTTLERKSNVVCTEDQVTLFIYCGLEGSSDLKTQPVTPPRDPAVTKLPRGAFTAVFPDSCSRLPILRGSWISGISSPKSHRSVFGQLGSTSDSFDGRRGSCAAHKVQMWRSWMVLEFKPSSKGPLSYQMLSTAMWNIHHGHGKHSISPEKHQQPVAESHKAV